jgi:hypothetical protein
MSTLQAFFLGIMVSWTPSLIFLVWVLRHVPLFGASRAAAKRQLG